MVSEMDRGIGQVLATLEDEGLQENTLVLFMSDNGGAARLGANNGRLRGGKGTTWEGGIRVPAVLWWPKRLKAGSIHDQMITAEDILPTLFGALDVSPEWAKPLDGSDQWSFIAEGQKAENRVHILARHDREQYLVALFQDEWKLVQMTNPDSGQLQLQLFRISEDPYEQNDLAAERPDVVEQLLARFRAIPRVPIIAINDPPIPTRTGLGGPASLVPDNQPPNREPYAEEAKQ